jgi:hypothetical protein
VRPALGFILANLLMAGAGAGVLLGLGVVRLRARELAAAGGLALITGMATLVLLEIILLVLGFEVPFRLGAALCVVLGLIGLAVALRRGPAQPDRHEGPGLATLVARVRDGAGRPGPQRAEHGGGWRARHRARMEGVHRVLGRDTDVLLIRVALFVSGVVLVIFVVQAFRAYTLAPTVTFDEFAIWSKKALVLFNYPGLHESFFANPAFNAIHLEYPIFLPALEAFVYRGIGEPDTSLMHGQLLLLFAAFAWALAWLVGRERRNLYWIPILIAVAVSPFVHVQQSTGLADITMASFGALGVLGIAQWLDRGDRGLLVLGALFLAASVNTKFEGLLTAVFAFAVAGIVVLVDRRPQRLIPLVGTGLLFSALVLPWRIWVAARPQIESFFNFRDGLSPSFLWEQRVRVGQAIDVFDQAIVDPNRLSYLVPLAGAMIVIAIATGVDRRLAVYYLSVALGIVAGVVWIYWVNPASFSPDRIISATAMVAVVALLHLGARITVTRPAADEAGSGDLAKDGDERLAERRAEGALQP